MLCVCFTAKNVLDSVQGIHVLVHHIEILTKARNLFYGMASREFII